MRVFGKPRPGKDEARPLNVLEWIKAKWNAAMIWPRWFYDVLVWIGCGFFVDSLIPDLPGSLGMGRARTMVWTMTRIYRVPWRVNEPLWGGIKACFKAHADMKRVALEYAKLEERLRPFMEPGESVEHFLSERAPQLLELARIGDQAMREKEEAKSKDNDKAVHI